MSDPISPEQHPLALSVALHLAPGAALLAFVVAAASLGVPALLALLAGIALVMVPLELGYLLLQGRRGTTGRWTLDGLVDYRRPLPPRQVALWAVPLVAWFVLFLVLSVGALDERVADGLFSWYPESVREFASFEDDDATYATWAVVAFFAAAFRDQWRRRPRG